MAYEPINTITSGVVLLSTNNIDTDQIIPARFLKATSRDADFGRKLFADWRYDNEGNPVADFPLNENMGEAKILLSGENFGCGSSREGAPRNLKQLGIGCVVAESFGRIFFRNCIATALPVLDCEGVSDLFQEGEQLELDFENARVKNLTTGKELQGPALPADLIDIVKKGGILSLIRSESQ